jgi:hypothetical protein
MLSWGLCAEDFAARHQIAAYANWLLPGYVMVGRYPFIEPSRCKERAQGEAQLEAILNAGITTFVCLQAEIPPQKEMPIGGVDGFLPYKATADLMAAGERPAGLDVPRKRALRATWQPFG